MTTIRPRPGDLEAACTPHAPVPSGERVTSLGPERCDLCGLSWSSPMHRSDRYVGPQVSDEEGDRK